MLNSFVIFTCLVSNLSRCFIWELAGEESNSSSVIECNIISVCFADNSPDCSIESLYKDTVKVRSRYLE